jgi:hypothetical protein
VSALLDHQGSPPTVTSADATGDAARCGGCRARSTHPPNSPAPTSRDARTAFAAWRRTQRLVPVMSGRDECPTITIRTGRRCHPALLRHVVSRVLSDAGACVRAHSRVGCRVAAVADGGGRDGGAGTAAVSRSCECIGSPCLRHCVHGASIGGGDGGGARGAARAVPPLRGGAAADAGAAGAGGLALSLAGCGRGGLHGQPFIRSTDKHAPLN